MDTDRQLLVETEQRYQARIEELEREKVQLRMAVRTLLEAYERRGGASSEFVAAMTRVRKVLG